MKHYSVLLNETIDRLDIKEDGIYVDATTGLGGHSKEIAKLIPKGQLISIDRDSLALEEAKKNLSEFNNITFKNTTFSNLPTILKELGIEKVDGILVDLGTSYYQLTDPERGFSYHGESKLDMRMDISQDITAIDILNNYEQEKLEFIFREYGDEKRNRQLALAIIEHRKNNKIETNVQLNEIIKSVKGYSKDKHPSKNIYQAIRIEVNNELDQLKQAMLEFPSLLKVGGKLAVITFHSLEDKITKEVFWEKKQEIEISVYGNEPYYKTSKSIYPTNEEVEENKASRSAKLRVLTKLK